MRTLRWYRFFHIAGRTKRTTRRRTRVQKRSTMVNVKNSGSHVHRHCGSELAPIDYAGPIDTAEPNPAAHGGHCVVEVCDCGLVRFVNVREAEREDGAWESGCEEIARAYLQRCGAVTRGAQRGLTQSPRVER